jgi:hypothetical protein
MPDYMQYQDKDGIFIILNLKFIILGIMPVLVVILNLVGALPVKQLKLVPPKSDYKYGGQSLLKKPHVWVMVFSNFNI